MENLQLFGPQPRPLILESDDDVSHKCRLGSPPHTFSTSMSVISPIDGVNRCHLQQGQAGCSPPHRALNS